jgi:hypothetical protein
VGQLALVEVCCLLAVALLAQIQACLEVWQPKEALPIRACLQVVVEGQACCLLFLGIRSCLQGQLALADGAGDQQVATIFFALGACINL